MRPGVLVCVTDLFFVAKIEETARSLGIPCRMVARAQDLAGEPPAGGVLIDLEADGGVGLALLRSLRSGPLPARVVAFGSHVRTDLLDEARRLGCERVLPRSRLSAELAEVLQGLAAFPPGARQP